MCRAHQGDKYYIGSSFSNYISPLVAKFRTYDVRTMECNPRSIHTSFINLNNWISSRYSRSNEPSRNKLQTTREKMEQERTLLAL